MRLAVVGSVNLTLPQWELATILIRGVIWDQGPDILISGGAKGIDLTAESCAEDFDLPTKIYLPKNQRWKPDGFEDRNLLIAQDCTHLLCIRTSQSTTYGSGWTADRAEEMGKTVWRVTI